MKRAIALFISILVLNFVLANCSGSTKIPDGAYTMTDSANGFGVGAKFTVKGNTMTIPIYGETGVDYIYQIDGKEIKLTAQGATVSYTYEKKGGSYIIGGAEYAIGTTTSTDNNSTDSLQTSKIDIDDNITVTDTTETNPIYEPLNLSIITKEETFFYNGSHGSLRITPDGILQRQLKEDTAVVDKWENIDTDVRSIHAFQYHEYYGIDIVFYIKNDNSLWGFGSNAGGWLGDGTGVDKETPVFILDNVATCYIQGKCAYALKVDKTFMFWGSWETEYFSPVLRADNVVNFYSNGWIIQMSDGNIYRLEFDNSLRLLTSEPTLDFLIQDNRVSYYINPDRLLMRYQIQEDSYIEVGSDVDKIFDGNNGNVFFIKSDGSLWGVGDNRNGELGDGTKVPRKEAVKIADDIVSGFAYGYLKADGTVWIWDENNPVPRKLLENVDFIDGVNVYFKDNSLMIPSADWERSLWFKLLEEKINDGDSEWGKLFFNNVRSPRTVIFE